MSNNLTALQDHTHSPSLDTIQSKPLLLLSPNDTTSEALARASRHGIHHLPITEHGRIVGMTCTCDLVEAKPDAPVSDTMHQNVIAATPSTTAEQAAELLRQAVVGAVVVVDDLRPVGIVTRQDLLTRAGAAAHHILREVSCECCASRRHLRAIGEERFLCVECQVRAQSEENAPWLEIGDSA